MVPSNPDPNTDTEGPEVPRAAPDRPVAPSSALRGFTVALSSVIGGFATAITPLQAREAWREHEAEGRRAEPLSIHVHVPFCETICTFCDCATEALQAPVQVERYLDALEQEMAFFDGVVPRAVDRLYVGGGTPNILSEAQLERLLGLVNRFHRFVPDAVKCVEGHPIHSSRSKLDVAAALGVNRVSYGVQSRDPRVLRRVNRGAQTDAHVERSVRDAFDAGIREVNLDFIYSLDDEASESTLSGVVWALSLAPTTVCLQLLNDSHYAAPYRDTAHRERVAVEFRELEARVCEQVAANAPGYECSWRPDTLLIHRRDMWRDWRRTPEYYAARDATFMSTLGYGRHAQSLLFGRLIYQNQERNSRFEPTVAQYSGRPRSPALEALVDVVAGWEHGGAVEVARVRENHGEAVSSTLDPLLDRLVGAGHIERVGGSIRVTGLTPEGVAWLAGRIAPGVARVTPPVDSIFVVERESTWRIRFEPARDDGRYFAVVRGVGLFYQADPATRLEGAMVTRIMTATVRHAERLLDGGCPREELASAIAAILDERLAATGLGVRVRIESSHPKRHRLTMLAPSQR
jgi:hypothetical protein